MSPNLPAEGGRMCHFFVRKAKKAFLTMTMEGHNMPPFAGTGSCIAGHQGAQGQKPFGRMHSIFRITGCRGTQSGSFLHDNPLLHQATEPSRSTYCGAQNVVWQCCPPFELHLLQHPSSTLRPAWLITSSKVLCDFIRHPPDAIPCGPPPNATLRRLRLQQLPSLCNPCDVLKHTWSDQWQ